MDEILDFLKREDADIVLMQEVYNGHEPFWERKFRSMDVLREALGYPYEHFAPAFLERTEFGKVEQGNAILSKLSLIEAASTPGDVPYGEREDKPEYYERTPRNLQRVAVEVEGRTLQVFNTQGVWGKDGDDNERRLMMAQSIVDAIKPFDFVVLAGDFNVQEKTKTIAMIEEHLVNVFKNDHRSTSFNMKHKTNPGFATAVVDMIFASPSLRALEHRQCDDNVSDHLALTVTLEYKPIFMFELPDLPFAKDELAPWTSAETFDFHHGKHHAGYVQKLNAAVLGNEFEGRSLEEVIAGSRDRNPKVFNLAAQHFNHSFFWNCLSATSQSPSGDLAVTIDRDFGSFEEFKIQFTDVATTHFGSGWVWLTRGADGKLAVKGFHDAQTPAQTDETPLLTLDVWEHAYYIDHRNNRVAFIEGFWDHVNWEFVGLQF
ncbi:MAG: Fe Superoxide dismutase [Candidatus Uhrbacteria bacterium GW2011_GWA2_52_8d]|uniref:superoxide dismutase n=1 Tax=Candidatus Uhrbacteria bacterium GW2011_GWA2_52_8d TaxID=1618979 RepID=A0A0G2AJE5_9BACT|nr:MAG: Fe Superoxide dismutase [Candidatus Uhrbacteria bacterium GW2011_GWA2_52_8d]